MNKILVTGGAGYIGSHTVVELLDRGWDVIVLDNFAGSRRSVIERLKQIAKRSFDLVEADVRDKSAIDSVFSTHPIDAVIHFAALKAVGESFDLPLDYYETNVAGTLNVLKAMRDHGVKRFVFSSSATVYGHPRENPIREDFPLCATNPYGRTKIVVEDVLRDVYASDKTWSIALLRYFNPTGAHSSGLIGENPRGIPNNLMPYIAQVASGRLSQLTVFGNDYPTADGTGVRDYIHVVDLAIGHVKALELLNSGPGLRTYNLGTGRGYSVMEMIAAFETATGSPIPYKVVGRRPGDIATCYADPTLAQNEMGWKAQRGIVEMCADAWRWQQNCPD
ncbi:MAG: UDP-glucose 4-epimerase GalE [Rhodospirillaceae bacterium]